MMIAATSTIFTRRLALADEDDDMSQEELDEYVKSVTAKNSGEVTYIDVDAEVEDSSLSSTFKMSSLWKLGSMITKNACLFLSNPSLLPSGLNLKVSPILAAKSHQAFSVAGGP